MIEPSSQEVNRRLVFLFKDDNSRESHRQYYLPTVEINNYNVMINGRNFFNQSMILKTYDNIRNIATGKGDDYTTGCFLGYP